MDVYIKGYLSSGKKTSSATIKTGKGWWGGVLIQTDGTNDATITIYDNTADSGTILYQAIVPAANRYGGVGPLAAPIRFNTGCRLTVAGTGASGIVWYR